MPSFSAVINIIGINPYVEVPADVLAALMKRSGKTAGPLPVKGTLNGKPFIQHIVKYRSLWRLYLNTPMRKSAGIDVGDMAVVKLQFDSSPRITVMHPALKKMLGNHPLAKARFETLPPYRKKEIQRYINNLKSAEAVKKNVEKILLHLEKRAPFAGRTSD